MRPRQPCARRPMRHPVRLVKLSGRPRSPIGETEAQDYRVGLEAARLLYEHFPDFYAQSQIDRELITMPLLLGCVAALGQLVELRGIELRWPGEHGGFYQQGLNRYELAPTPLETLRMYGGVAEGFLYELHAFVWAPQPMYYGWGVQSLLDGESDGNGADLLTVTLWHLFGRTPMGLGVKLHDVLKAIGGVDEDDIFDICRIKQLPADVPLQLLGANLTLPVADEYSVSVLDLLAYPFGKASNPLAN